MMIPKKVAKMPGGPPPMMPGEMGGGSALPPMPFKKGGDMKKAPVKKSGKKAARSR